MRDSPLLSENMIIFLRRNYPHQVPEFGARCHLSLSAPPIIFSTPKLYTRKDKKSSTISIVILYKKSEIDLDKIIRYIV